MNKRLGQLQDRLKAGSVSAAAVSSLHQLLTSLNAGDVAGAQGQLVQLSTGNNDVGNAALVGLKYLIALLKL